MYPVPLTHPLPTPNDPGSFGAWRKYDIHTGIDLYTFDKAPVRALQDGVIVAFEDFTGALAGSPWWNDTSAIMVENDKGVILYGELVIAPNLKIGSPIQRGTLLGHVTPVLKKDKGKNPKTMLHLECYEKGTRQSVWWYHHEPCPQNLRDPSSLLQDVFKPPHDFFKKRPR